MVKRCVLACALALAAIVAGAQVTSDFSLVLKIMSSLVRDLV